MLFSYSCAFPCFYEVETAEENVPANDAAVFYLGSPLWLLAGRGGSQGGGGDGWQQGLPGRLLARWHTTLISNDLPPIGAEARPSR